MWFWDNNVFLISKKNIIIKKIFTFYSQIEKFKAHNVARSMSIYSKKYILYFYVSDHTKRKRKRK